MTNTSNILVALRLAFVNRLSPWDMVKIHLCKHSIIAMNWDLLFLKLHLVLKCFAVLLFSRLIYFFFSKLKCKKIKLGDFGFRNYKIMKWIGKKIYIYCIYVMYSYRQKHVDTKEIHYVQAELEFRAPDSQELLKFHR